MLQPNAVSTDDGLGGAARAVSRAKPARSASPGSASIAAVAEDTGLRRYYERLLTYFGPQGWWPAETRLEVILGAILTQNTAWRNAALAIARLRDAGMLNLDRLRAAGPGRLQSLIRPAGFFRQKARAIQGFLLWLDEAHSGSLDLMFSRPVAELRSALLRRNGLGPETVDAILLYAGGKPFFVADAYTRRILARHGFLPADAGYDQTQEWIHDRLGRDAAVYNEFHALLVEVGKRYCRRQKAHCEGCPLATFLPQGRLSPGSAGV
jgi:endonuclease III related protein